MGEHISEENPRIKFHVERVGHVTSLTEECMGDLQALGELQKYLEDVGVIPILNDGLVGGNCAVICQDSKGEQHLFVSRSGKAPGYLLQPDDFVEIVKFEREHWMAMFRSSADDVRPTSDTPLHVAALLDSQERFGWEEVPFVAVHGHALGDEPGISKALEAGIPVSEELTMFSTAEDLKALEKLFTSHKYPHTQCFIRRGHGFFLLAKDVKHAAHYFNSVLEPLIVSSAT